MAAMHVSSHSSFALPHLCNPACILTQHTHADKVLNFCFTAEAILRILAAGSFKAYIRSMWNTFDFLIIALGYVGYIDIGNGATGVRALRGFRALRPLRTMSRFQALRTIIDCFLTVRFIDPEPS
jgi:hypothetical protein